VGPYDDFAVSVSQICCDTWSTGNNIKLSQSTKT